MIIMVTMTFPPMMAANGGMINSFVYIYIYIRGTCLGSMMSLSFFFKKNICVLLPVLRFIVELFSALRVPGC
jgi:hypothetical protein